MNLNYTLFGQSIAFLFFVLFCMKFVWPPLLAAMQAREKRIEDGLLAAERADKNLEFAQQQADEQVGEAKQQAAAIVDQAKKRGSLMVDEAKQQAKDEADRIKAAAQAEIDQEILQAKEALRAQVATLAIAGAEKILGESVDKAKHAAMLEKLAAEL